MEKTNITYHKYLGHDNSYMYIGFNKSLETTTRMQAMTRGLDRFDRWAKTWEWIHYAITSPLHRILNAKWTKKLAQYTFIRF